MTFLILQDPFLYFGIAVWPLSYFLYKWPFAFPKAWQGKNVVDWFKNFNGFYVPSNFKEGETVLIPQKQKRTYVDMVVHFGGLEWNLYKVCSMLFLSGFIYVMFFETNFNTNIDLLRTQNYTDVVGTGHWIIWLAAFLVYFRFGAPFDFVKGIYAMSFFGGLHEGMWYLTYIASVAGIKALYINSPFLILITGIMFGYLLLFRKRHDDKSKLPSENAWLSWKRITVIVLAMAMFYFLWLEAGFPTTLDIFTGRTAFYYSLPVNLIENLSWIMPAFLFVV